LCVCVCQHVYVRAFYVWNIYCNLIISQEVSDWTYTGIINLPGCLFFVGITVGVLLLYIEKQI